MAVTFGRFSPEFVIPLPRIGDWRFALAPVPPEVWPDGIEIELRFYRTADPAGDPSPLVHAATVTDEAVSWHLSAAQLAAVRAAGAGYAWLVYTDDAGTPLEWMRGTVRAA